MEPLRLRADRLDAEVVRWLSLRWLAVVEGDADGEGVTITLHEYGGGETQNGKIQKS